jgi:hypothetical protein
MIFIPMQIIGGNNTGVWRFPQENQACRLQGPKERAAFQTVLKRRAHMLLIASVSVQNIRQFVTVVAS